MTTFAEKNIVFPDGQLNVAPLPEAVMINGFTPETRDAPGMPLPAQYLNWLFRDIYRKASQLEEKTNTLNERVIPAWMPIACPMADAPAGYLKCNGAAFDKELYPELAMGYPSGKLPDLRGEFIRGWDDGRGVDSSRELLKLQYDSISEHVHNSLYYVGNNRPKEVPYLSVTNRVSLSTLNGSSGQPMDVDDFPTDFFGSGSCYVSIETSKFGLTETRPRNISFLYIVRAA